ncbi:hypothetical protein AVEN_163604-1 [Araneus ventricosus]|uniref:Uncharacterized protein n=1 Tax=Araneus ventricosus TaxID=182803 RepID=A0A4Y2TAZ8_ARAVE|nr:hypothetical protein AVEN_163604-1 [Araneus ventricosus]
MWIRTQVPYPESNSLGNKELSPVIYLKMTDIQFRVPPSHRKESDHMMPGAIEPSLGLNNVTTFYLLFCPKIGNMWTSRSKRNCWILIH